MFLNRLFMLLIYGVQFYAFQYLFDFEYFLFVVTILLSCQKSKTKLLTPAERTSGSNIHDAQPVMFTCRPRDPIPEVASQYPNSFVAV